MFRASEHPKDVVRDPYLTQKIMSASPEQLIGYVYDAIIVACTKEDRERALRGIQGLISSLNFDYKDLAVPMFQLYQYCLDQIRQGEFVEVKELISGLKAAWSEAMKVN